MRFKAKLAPEQVSFLHSVIVPLSKLSSSSSSGTSGGGTNISTSNNILSTKNLSNNNDNGIAIISIDNNDFKISCKGRRTGLSSTSSSMNNNNGSGTDGIITYTELVAYNGIFIEYRIDSIAPNNQIVMEIDLHQFKSALKSIIAGNSTTNSKNTSSSLLNTDPSTQYTIIKLAKRQNIPCLCLDACTIASSCSSSNNNNTTTNASTTTGTTAGGGLIQIHHALPVRILRAAEFDEYYLPPVVPLPDLQLELITTNTVSSAITPLRIIIDRLRYMSNIVYLEGTQKGELTIRIHTDGASIRTFYSKLQTRHEGCKQQYDRNQALNTSHRPVIMKVDTKKLYTALQWQSTSLSSSSVSSSSSPAGNNTPNVSSALLCLIENEMLVVHVTLNPASIGFITYYVPVHYVSTTSPDEDD